MFTNNLDSDQQKKGIVKLSFKAKFVGPNLKTGVFSTSDTGSQFLNKASCFLLPGNWTWFRNGLALLPHVAYQNKQCLTNPNGQCPQGLTSA